MKVIATASVCIGLAALGVLLAARTAKGSTKNTEKKAISPNPASPSSGKYNANTKLPKITGPRSWKHITTTTASISAGRAYAGVIQLEGLKAVFGNAKDVEEKLRGLCSWERLEVSDKPIKARFPVPWTTVEKADRYWAIGVASSSAPAAEVPEQVIQLFER